MEDEDDLDLTGDEGIPDADPSDPLKGKLYPYLRDRVKRRQLMEQDRRELRDQSTERSQGALLAALSKGSSMIGSLGGKTADSTIIPDMNKRLGDQFQQDRTAELGMRKAEQGERMFEETQQAKRDALYARLRQKKPKTYKESDFESNGRPLLLDSEGGYTVGNVPAGTKRKPPAMGQMGFGNVVPNVAGEGGGVVTYNSKTGKMDTVQLPEGAKQSGAKVTSGTAQEIGSFDSAQDMLDQLGAKYNALAAAPGSGAKAMIPGTDANLYEKNRNVAAQTIGIILEKGKLTDSDYQRYRDMMPKPTDRNDVAAEKIAAVRNLIAAKRRGEIGGLKQSGFETKGFNPDAPAPAGVAQPPPSAPAAHPQAGAAEAWARDHPGDPRSAEILKRLGGG